MILGYTSQSIKNILASHCDYVCTTKLSKSGSALALALALRESGVGVFIHWATCSSLQKRDPTETEVGKPTGHQTAIDPEGLAQVYVRGAPAARESHHAVGVCTPRDCGCGRPTAGQALGMEHWESVTYRAVSTAWKTWP